MSASDRRGVDAGRGCRQVRRTRVVCRVRGSLPDYSAGLSVRLGDEDDRAVLRGAPRGGALVRGGPGDDAITGSRASDALSGDGGADRVRGGRGNDTLTGDGGADVLGGGRGQDTVGYFGTRGVRADLEGDADDGRPGERDRILRDVERLTGGFGDDELTGDARANRLDGGVGGIDTLRGGAGGDDLRANGGTALGEAGNDVIEASGSGTFDGGPGRDWIRAYRAGTVESRDGEADEIACPTNAEEGVVSADALDVVVGCRQVSREGAPAARPVAGIGLDGRLTGRRVNSLYVRFGFDRTVEVVLGCSTDQVAGCPVRVLLTDAQGTVIDQTRTLTPGALDVFESARLARDRRGPFSLRVESTDAAGNPVVIESP